LFHTFEYFFLHRRKGSSAVSQTISTIPRYSASISGKTSFAKTMCQFRVDYDTLAGHFQDQLKVATPNLEYPFMPPFPRRAAA